MSGTSTVQLQSQNENMATSIEHLNIKEPQQNKEMMNNIIDSYQDMELHENDDDNPEEIYNRRMMDDVNEPNQQQQQYSQDDPSYDVQPPVIQQKSLANKLMDTLKGPFIVMVLFFVLNMEFVINMVNSVFKGYLGDESNYNMYGLLCRSVLSAILFYALNFFS
jgi:hypothetical protein